MGPRFGRNSEIRTENYPRESVDTFSRRIAYYLTWSRGHVSRDFYTRIENAFLLSFSRTRKITNSIRIVFFLSGPIAIYCRVQRREFNVIIGKAFIRSKWIGRKTTVITSAVSARAHVSIYLRQSIFPPGCGTDIVLW